MRVYFETYVEVDAKTYHEAIDEAMDFVAKDYPSLPVVDESVVVEDENGLVSPVEPDDPVNVVAATDAPSIDPSVDIR
jgi:hypothetical protein